MQPIVQKRVLQVKKISLKLEFSRDETTRHSGHELFQKYLIIVLLYKCDS